MENHKSRNFFLVVLSNLGWPLFWGLSLWVCFYALIYRGVIPYQIVRRYFAGHPVEYIEAAMFFVGVAALAIKLSQIVQHWLALGFVKLGPIPPGGQPVEACAQLLQQLTQLPERVRNSQLANRVYEALEFVRRKGSADGLDDQLKYLGDVEAVRMQDSNGLVRIIIWATPMLGFLGTVIGITLALGGLSPEMLVESPQQAMEGLLAGLSVAFDTTALALSFSLLLMFFQFLTDQFENQLISAVDAQTEELLVGRFQEFGSGNDPQLASVRRMMETVVQSSEDLVHRQVQLWQTTMDTSHQQWSRLMAAASEQLQNSLTTSLAQSLQAHARELGQTELAVAKQGRQHWSELQELMSDYAKAVHGQQAELSKQTAVMREVVAATGDVAKLEEVLNRNLKSLAGAKNFEDTVMSLAAVIHLLNSRLAGSSSEVPQIDLTHKSKTKDAQGRAA